VRKKIWTFVAIGGLPAIGAATGGGGFAQARLPRTFVEGEVVAAPELGSLILEVWAYDGETPCVDGMLPEDTDEENFTLSYNFVMLAGGEPFAFRVDMYGLPFIVDVVESSEESLHYFPPIEGDDSQVGCFDEYSNQYTPDHLDIGTLAIDAPNDGIEDLVDAYAELHDITLLEAQLRIEQEETVGENLYSIADEIENGEVDLWVDDSTGDLVLHARTGDIGILDVLDDAASEAGMDLIIEGATPVAAEATAFVNSLYDELYEAIPELAGFYVDVETVELALDLVDDSQNSSQGSPSGGQRSPTVEERAILAAEALTALPTRVDSVSNWVGNDTAVYGGVVTAGTGYSKYCTAGFTATYKSGSTTYQGFLTAAHCTKTTHYYYNIGGTGVKSKATFRAQTYNQNADIAFYSIVSSDRINSLFFGTSATNIKYHQGRAVALVGNTVFKRGRVTGHQAGIVKSISFNPGNSCGPVGKFVKCNPNFVKTTAKRDGGDSGGPVWMGTGSSVGIHTGGGVVGTAYWAYYSKIQYVPTGVTVKIGFP